MKRIVILLAVLLLAGDALAQCKASDLVGLGINNIQAQALGCDRLVGNTSITGTLTSSGALTTTAGGHTITAGGLTVTAGGITVTAGKVSAGAGVVYPAALYETIAAAGTATGDGALTAGKFIHAISASDETKVVTLPACAAANVGEVHTLLNLVSNKFLKVCPITGSTLNGGGSGACAAMAAAGNNRNATCFCQAAATWICG